MPTLELFTIPSDPNACHNVIAPGGYEYWDFDLKSDAGLMVIRFCYGCSPEYLKRYRAYRAAPTKVAPPLPREFVAVECSLVRPDGGGQSGVSVRVAADDFAASCDRLEVRTPVGACIARDTGTIEVTVRHADIDCELLVRDGMATGRISIGDVRIDPFRGRALFVHEFGTSPEYT